MPHAQDLRHAGFPERATLLLLHDRKDKQAKRKGRSRYRPRPPICVTCPCGRGLHRSSFARVSGGFRSGARSVGSDVGGSVGGFDSSFGGFFSRLFRAASESKGGAGDSGEDELAHALQSLD